jgi:hypothetical protein
MPDTVSPRGLNRALLARQLLLERSKLPLTGVLEAMAGQQAQYAPSMYVGLWSRMDGFERRLLTSALEDGTVVQGTLLRSTIHLVSAHDYWPFALATRAARRESWLRIRQLALTDEDMTAAAARVRDRLRQGPMKRKELDELVGRPQSNVVGAWLDMVRVPPSGTWERRRADLYAAAEEWLGPPPPTVTADAGIELLVRRYLGGFGPAARADIANWAGLSIGDVSPIVDRLPLRRIRADDGEELVDLEDAPLPDPDAPAPVRFLPTWDASLLVHARRKGILAEEYRPLVFNTKTPHSVNTFLVEGAVAGTWRYERGAVRIEPFGRLSRSKRDELDEEAHRLAALHA